MRIFFIILFFFSLQITVSQNIQIARNYFNQNEFEKAIIAYENLDKLNPNNAQISLELAQCYREVKHFNTAITFLNKKLQKKPEQPLLLIELGVIHKQNKNEIKAQESFNKALNILNKKPTMGSFLAQKFKEHHLLKPAIAAYKKTMLSNPAYRFDYEIALMYGELGMLGEMFNHYTEHMLKRESYIGIIKRRMDEFITDDSENEANIVFRKTLLKKNQQNPNILYNELLSWLFVQQKQYRKAFLQEKAILKKTDEGMPQLFNLASTCINVKEYETANEILNFVIEVDESNSYKARAHQQLLKIKTKTATSKEYASINNEYLKRIEEYKNQSQSTNLILDYSRFLGFTQNKKQEAIKFLKPFIKKSFTPIEKAKMEILLADILLLNNQFNQALIYYTKAKKRNKNHPLAQEASFKIAKASYYKGDFDWAKTQLNVLKASTSKLIANDAMDLSLLLEDNTQDDSTHIALKLYAKAELYSFQEQDEKALSTYQNLLDNHKGKSIEDDALYKQALLFLKNRKTELAIVNLEKIVDLFKDSLLLDDSYFLLGQLFEVKGDTESAKINYEQIIFNHADSIHYVDARKAYRKLRGDTIVN